MDLHSLPYPTILFHVQVACCDLVSHCAVSTKHTIACIYETIIHPLQLQNMYYNGKRRSGLSILALSSYTLANGSFPLQTFPD